MTTSSSKSCPIGRADCALHERPHELPRGSREVLGRGAELKRERLTQHRLNVLHAHRRDLNDPLELFVAFEILKAIQADRYLLLRLVTVRKGKFDQHVLAGGDRNAVVDRAGGEVVGIGRPSNAELRAILHGRFSVEH